MFDLQPRRHPLQTFPFWFLIAICAGAVIAWRWELFSPSEPLAEAMPFIEDEPMPPPPGDETDWASIELGKEEPAPAPFQLESDPLRPETPERSQAADRAGDRDRRERERPEASIGTLHAVTATSPPSGRGEVRTASANLPGRPVNESEDQPARDADRQIDLAEADRLMAAGDDVGAHRLLSTWYWERPQQRPRFQERLDLLSRRIYFQPQPHYMDPWQVQFGDRLETVAKRNNLTWEYLARLNRIEPQRIQPGQKLKVIRGPFSAVVDLSSFELTVHAHGYYVTRFPVGIGTDGSTPIGRFQVTDKVLDPTWYGPEGVIAHDDPENPLGERWIAISDEQGTLQGYGIHGTIDPSSIGKAASRGCIRLKERDVADLYDLLTVGSEVIIRR